MRALRYVQWLSDPDPEDETCSADYAFLLRDESGTVAVAHDRHVHGLFPRAVWLDTLAVVGFEDGRAVPFEHSELEPGSHEVFVARRPTGEESP